jgi:uncharacterized protein (TIGR00255 family)
MTGYGRAEKEALGKRFSLELKSVNHRYLEVSLRHPRKYLKMEEKVRKIISEYIKRGHVEVFVKVKNTEEQDVSIKVDKAAAMTYYNSLNELSEMLKIANDVSLEKIITLPEIISIEERKRISTRFGNTMKRFSGKLLYRILKCVLKRADTLKKTL